MSALPETAICYSQRTGLAKVRYESEAKANRARIRIQSKSNPKRGLEVYRCPLGNDHWHLRSKRNEVKRWDGQPDVHRLPSL